MDMLLLALLYPVLTLASVFFIIKSNERNQEKFLQTIMSLTGNVDKYMQIDSYNKAQARQTVLASKEKKTKKPSEPEGLKVF